MPKETYNGHRYIAEKTWMFLYPWLAFREMVPVG